MHIVHDMAECLIAVLEARDPITAGHSQKELQI